jgi:hypothetical protein
VRFHKALRRRGACGESVEWIKENDFSLPEAWFACIRPDWLFWLAVDAQIPSRLLMGALIDGVHAALPGDWRDRVAPRYRDLFEAMRAGIGVDAPTHSTRPLERAIDGVFYFYTRGWRDTPTAIQTSVVRIFAALKSETDGGDDVRFGPPDVRACNAIRNVISLRHLAEHADWIKPFVDGPQKTDAGPPKPAAPADALPANRFRLQVGPEIRFEASPPDKNYLRALEALARIAAGLELPGGPSTAARQNTIRAAAYAFTTAVSLQYGDADD